MVLVFERILKSVRKVILYFFNICPRFQNTFDWKMFSIGDEIGRVQIFKYRKFPAALNSSLKTEIDFQNKD